MRLALWLIAGFLVGCSPSDGEHAVEAIFLALDIAAGERPSAYKKWKDAPERQEIAYDIDGRIYVGDLYRPKSARASLVLVPGLHREGRRESHLVALATTLGRAGFEVVVPDLPNYRALRIGADDPTGIADAARYLIEQVQDGRKIGIAGISYASGPAILAATAPDIASRVDFIFALGGYYDLESILVYMVTARYREKPDEPWRIGSPNDYGSWLFVAANLGRLSDAEDRAKLGIVVTRRLADRRAAISDIVETLGPEGSSIMALLGEADPDSIPERVAALPEYLRRDFDALTLKGKPLERLKGRAILLHGRDDAIVPYTESLRLAEALGPDHAELHVARRLAHVDFDPEGVADGLAVWRAGLALLRQRR